MRRRVATTAVVGFVVGGLIGLAFAPWWAWGLAGAAIGAAYAAALTALGTWLLAWLRRGSPERHVGVLVGGTIGALVAALAGAVAAVARFVPPAAGDSAELFAVGMIGVAAGGPLGFVAGGLGGGLLTAFYEWLDARYVAPLRARSAVVERATTAGAAFGVLTAVVLIAVFGLHRRGAPRPDTPPWLGPTLLVLGLLGLFWALRAPAKRNREAAVSHAARLAQPNWRAVALGQTVGFAGGAVGFLIGAALHTFGWRSGPKEQKVADGRKAGPA